MKKLTTPLILLLCAGLIFLGSRLPHTVAAIQDDVDINQVYYAPISDVHLEFDEDGLTLKQMMLAKIGAKTNVPVPGKFCSRTQDNVMSIAQETINAYANAGLLPFDIHVNETMTDCKAFLSYSYYTESSGVFWDLVLCAPEWSDWNLTMTIDDQSGRVLEISFLYYQEEIYTTPVDDYQNAFCELFLEELGPEFSLYDEAYRSKQTQSTPNGTDVQTFIEWWDPDYDDVRLVLDLHPSGFSAYVIILSSK